jgi:hypothetical protein
VTAFFSKYWIFLVILVLLLIAISSPPVFYTIGYWIFWTILLVLLLVPSSSFLSFHAIILLAGVIRVFTPHAVSLLDIAGSLFVYRVDRRVCVSIPGYSQLVDEYDGIGREME